MKRKGVAQKVGWFVTICLVLVAVLVIKFSKGTNPFASTYTLNLKTPDVGSLIPGARVLMSGVPVGRVLTIQLTSTHQAVLVGVEIYSQYKIHRGAVFSIQQSGFLGDQYVAIMPGLSSAPVLEKGAVLDCQPPFNLQSAAKAALSLIDAITTTVDRLKGTVDRVDRILFSEQTLTNITDTVRHFRDLSSRALHTVGGVDRLVQSNATNVTVAVSNLAALSSDLDQTMKDLHLFVRTNKTDISQTIRNLRQVSAQANGILAGLRKGEGVMGSLLYDASLKNQLRHLIDNLTDLSSNLSQHGLFWKPQKPLAPLPPSYTGRNPFKNQ